jgi:hypothetical protein
MLCRVDGTSVTRGSIDQLEPCHFIHIPASRCFARVRTDCDVAISLLLLGLGIALSSCFALLCLFGGIYLFEFR